VLCQIYKVIGLLTKDTPYSITTFVTKINLNYSVGRFDRVVLLSPQVDTKTGTDVHIFISVKYDIGKMAAMFRRVRKIAKRDYCLRHVCPSVRPTVRLPNRLSARNNSAPTGRTLEYFGIFFENMSRKFKFIQI
jgi:hypothetical protein